MRIAADSQTIGALIREARHAKKLSQLEMVFEMNVLLRKRYPQSKRGLISLDWLRQIERGDPQTVSTERIGYAAEVLGIPVSQLLPVIDPAETETDVGDVVLALRGYGVSEQSVEKILQYIKEDKDRDGTVKEELGGPIPKPTEAPETGE